MKGPGLRLRNDVRRCWRCPETGNVLKTPGAVTYLYSPFVKQAQWMKLEENEPLARKQIPLQEILERMVIVVSEEEEAASEDNSEPKQSEPKQEETAETETPDREQVQDDLDRDCDP